MIRRKLTKQKILHPTTNPWSITTTGINPWGISESSSLNYRGDSAKGTEMFNVKVCGTVKEAAECAKKILAELDIPKELEFQVIHSLSETECDENGGTWDDTSPLLMHYLRELDGQNGYMMYDGGHGGFWDFIDWELPDPKKPHQMPDIDQCFVFSGEGLVVIHNEFALCEDEFPVVIVKKSFWEQQGDEILKSLKTIHHGVDYTTKFSPAVYVELFFAE